MTYYYVVHAEDTSTGNGGACGGGNVEANSVMVSGTPYGAGIQPAPGTWTDGGGDGNAFAQLNVAGSGNTGGKVWRFVKTADDPGANHTPGGTYAYRNAGPAPGSTYAPSTCAELRMPPVTAAGSTVNLQYWERHQLEYLSDAVAVEYSVNGGFWNDVPPPSDSEALGCAASDDATDYETLSCGCVGRLWLQCLGSRLQRPLRRRHDLRGLFDERHGRPVRPPLPPDHGPLARRLDPVPVAFLVRSWGDRFRRLLPRRHRGHQRSSSERLRSGHLRRAVERDELRRRRSLHRRR